MALLAPDALVETRIRNALKNICANPDILNEPLGAFLPDGIADIKSFFRGRAIPVLGGWPTEAQQVPCVTVQLRPSSEAVEMQPINPTAFAYEGDNAIVYYSSFWRSVVQCTCYGNNQRESTYLAFAVKWVLLLIRGQLELEGLLEQVLSISDFEPVPAYMNPNTPWFLRTVTLAATHEDQIAITQGPLIADILVTTQDVDGTPL
jgi:hypothetical protein